MISASAIAIYAAIVSTLSLVLAARAHRVGGPIVDVRWDYLEAARKLTTIVTNTGRTDVTVTALDLFILLEQSVVRLRASRTSYWGSRLVEDSRTERTIVARVPATEWCLDFQAVGFPIRLPAYDTFSVVISNEAIRHLSLQYPQGSLLLKFVAKIPQDEKVVYCGGDILQHFISSDPGTSVSQGRVIAP